MEARDEEAKIAEFGIGLGVGIGSGDRAGVRAVQESVGPVVNESDYSPKVKKSRSLKVKSDQSPCEIAASEVVDMAAYKAAVTIHHPAVFEASKWKRSRIKKGWLIARIKGYDPVESEYGVSYLKVLSRRPKKTSGDYSLHEHAGFVTWQALQAGGRLVKERKRNGRLNEDRANAS